MFIEESYNVGDWIAVMYHDDWYPGEIIDIKEMLQVKCVQKVKGDKLSWPERDDVSWYHFNEIMCNIQPPVPVNSALRSFCLLPSDLLNIHSKLK